MTLDNNLMMRIRNAANVIKITNMSYNQQLTFLANTCPPGADFMDWVASVAYYMAYDATGGEKLQAAE